MDWFTLLLVFIFFILPLIQQVLESAQKAKRLPPSEGADEQLEPGMAEVEPQRRPGVPAERRTGSAAPPRERIPRPRSESESGGSGSWSDGWGAWPTTIEPEAETAEPMETWDARPLPEAVPDTRREDSPAPEPIVLWEPPPETRIERTPLEDAAQRRPRLPEVKTGYPPARPESLELRRREPRKRAAPVDVRIPGAARHAESTRHGVARGLGSRAEIRRAIVLSEVLGPPVGMRLPE